MNRQLLTVVQWRSGILLLATLFVMLDLWAASYWARSLDPLAAGTLDVRYESNPHFNRRTIESLGPRSPLAQHGVKPGDVLAYDRPGDSRRDFGIDESIPVTVYSGEHIQHLEVQPAAREMIPATGRFVYLLVFTLAVPALVIALLLALRRPESLPMRYLALLLLVWVYEPALRNLPGGTLREVLANLSPFWPFMAYYALFVTFALHYPEPAPLWHYRAVRVGYRVYLLVFGLWACLYTALSIRFFTHYGLETLVKTGSQILVMASVALALGALSFSWRRCSGITRQRLGWIIMCLGAAYLWGFFNNLIAALNPDILPWFQPLGSVISILAFCGLGYAILRHRVFDFGFAVNRALVYSIVSFVLLAAFFAIKSVAESVLKIESGNSNALLNGSIALAIFVVFHRVHDFVEHHVERWLFRQWHLNEQALRQFVRQAAHITQTDALLAAFNAALDRFTGNGGNAIYRRTDGGHFVRIRDTLSAAPERLDVDDPVVVAMRTDGKPIECDEVHSKLPAALGVPMAHRGELEGVVLLGGKANHERFRPDEVELLGFAAHQVGLDLYAQQVAELRRETSALAQQASAFALEAKFARERESEMRALVEGALRSKSAAAP